MSRNKKKDVVACYYSCSRRDYDYDDEEEEYC